MAGTVLSLLLFYQTTMGPQTLVSHRECAAEELARRGAQLASFTIPCSHIHSSLLSDWRRTVSPKFFGTQVPTISIKELVLSRHACCVLSHLCCNRHSLLLSSYFSRIGRIENPSCRTLVTGHLSFHSALSSYRFFVLLTLWRLSVSLQSLVQTLESCLVSGAPWSSAPCPHPSEGVR